VGQREGGREGLGAQPLREAQELVGDAAQRADPSAVGRGRAQRRAPKEEGTLRGSLSVSPARDLGGRMAVEVGFNTPYAAAQHEGHAIMHRGGRPASFSLSSSELGSSDVLSLGTAYEWRVRHYTESGTGPKYLENPLKELAPRFDADLGREIKRQLAWRR
jgi:hypothetical protein